MDSDFNSAAITDVVLVADTDVADFALAAGGEKGVICAQCGAGPSTYPPSDAPTIRVINGNAEVWFFRGGRTAHNGLVAPYPWCMADFENGPSRTEQGRNYELANKLYFVSELTGLGAPTFNAVIGLVW